MGTVRWFGQSWGAPVCSDPFDHVATPVGRACLWCYELIVDGDAGLIVPHTTRQGVADEPRHVDCFVREVLGGLNHLRGRCTCSGGTEPPDPPGLTLRQAATAAVDFFNIRRSKP